MKGHEKLNNEYKFGSLELVNVNRIYYAKKPSQELANG